MTSECPGCKEPGYDCPEHRERYWLISYTYHYNGGFSSSRTPYVNQIISSVSPADWLLSQLEEARSINNQMMNIQTEVGFTIGNYHADPPIVTNTIEISKYQYDQLKNTNMIHVHRTATQENSSQR